MNQELANHIKKFLRAREAVFNLMNAHDAAVAKRSLPDSASYSGSSGVHHAAGEVVEQQDFLSDSESSSSESSDERFERATRSPRLKASSQHGSEFFPESKNVECATCSSSIVKPATSEKLAASSSTHACDKVYSCVT